MMPLFGPPNIWKMQTKGDVKGLIKAMSYKKNSNNAEHRRLRQNAATALAQINTPRAVNSLIVALKHEDWEVRNSAAFALGRVGDPCAIDPLLDALKDWPLRVRLAAATALEQIGWNPDMGEVGARFWVAKQQWSVCVKIGSPAVDPLVDVLKMGDWKVREDAAVALGRIGDPRAIDPLIDAFNTNTLDWNVRAAAATALGLINGPRVVDRLIAALKDDHWKVRENAAVALGRIGDPRAIDPLIDALKDGCTTNVRGAAATALGQIGDFRAVDPLIVALKDNHNSYVREIAITALEQIGWKPD